MFIPKTVSGKMQFGRNARVFWTGIPFCLDYQLFEWGGQPPITFHLLTTQQKKSAVLLAS